MGIHIPPGTMVIFPTLKTINAARRGRLEKKGIPLSWYEYRLEAASIMERPQMTEEKLSPWAKPRIGCSHTGACILRKPYGKSTSSKEQCSVIPNRQDTASIPSRRSELKQDVPLRCGRLFLIPVKPPLKLQNYDAGGRRDGLIHKGKSVMQRQNVVHEEFSR